MTVGVASRAAAGGQVGRAASGLGDGQAGLGGALGAGMLVVVGLAACWVVSVALGGAAHIAPHWFYLPVMYAGLRFGRRGAAVTAGAAVVVAGPLLPADVHSWTPQAASDWVSRGLFFVLIGMVVAHLFARLRQAGTNERDAAELRAQVAAQDRFRVLVESVSDVITVLDAEGTVVSRDGPVAVVFGPAAASADGRLDALLHPEDRDVLTDALTQLPARGPAGGGTQVLRCRVADGAGGWRHLESTLRDLRADSAVAGIVVTTRDVTAQTVLERQLRHQAHHDALTGLPNRTLLTDRFTQALTAGQRTGRPTGLMLLDLDRFKDINDTLGHASGDQLLTQVAGRLVGALRASDTVARLGGDEFAVLLPEVSGMAGALAVAKTLREALQQPFPVGGVELSVEASIGVVTTDQHGHDSELLLQRADMAMYTAKRKGGAAVSFHSTDKRSSTAELSMLGQLRPALDRAELVLHYQPQVDLADGTLSGVEALVRWQHPHRGLLAPALFLPAAERTGLINPLTRYVLDAALAQARRWLDTGQAVQVAVNISARNLIQDDLPQQVADLLARHGVPAELLQLELTESAIMTEPDRASGQLRALAALGVQIAIDDFGAGYTSLGQLKDLPISQLKIDRSFICAMTTDTSSATIVRGIIDLSHHLGLTTVAEGVELANDLDTLRAYGCDTAQGYYLSRPITATALQQWRQARTHPDPCTARVRAALTAAVPRLPYGDASQAYGC